jgi:hypothetical protein
MLVANDRRCLKPKDTPEDCPSCPEMVVVRAGEFEFMMGSPEQVTWNAPETVHVALLWRPDDLRSPRI